MVSLSQSDYRTLSLATASQIGAPLPDLDSKPESDDNKSVKSVFEARTKKEKVAARKSARSARLKLRMELKKTKPDEKFLDVNTPIDTRSMIDFAFDTKSTKTGKSAFTSVSQKKVLKKMKPITQLGFTNSDVVSEVQSVYSTNDDRESSDEAEQQETLPETRKMDAMSLALTDIDPSELLHSRPKDIALRLGIGKTNSMKNLNSGIEAVRSRQNMSKEQKDDVDVQRGVEEAIEDMKVMNIRDRVQNNRENDCLSQALSDDISDEDFESLSSERSEEIFQKRSRSRSRENKPETVSKYRQTSRQRERSNSRNRQSLTDKYVKMHEMETEEDETENKISNWISEINDSTKKSKSSVKNTIEDLKPSGYKFRTRKQPSISEMLQNDEDYKPKKLDDDDRSVRSYSRSKYGSEDNFRQSRNYDDNDRPSRAKKYDDDSRSVTSNISKRDKKLKYVGKDLDKSRRRSGSKYERRDSDERSVSSMRSGTGRKLRGFSNYEPDDDIYKV